MGSWETDALDPAKWLAGQKGLRDLGFLAYNPLAMRHVENLLAENEALRAALVEIRDAHAPPYEVGASCAEGCGGRFPCLAWSAADSALNAE